MSAQAAVTEYHWQGCLNNIHLFLTVREDGKSKIKVSTRICSWWGSASWLADSHHAPVCSQAPFVCVFSPKESSGASPSYEDTNPITGPPPSWPSLTLITFQKPYLHIPSYWGVGVSTPELGQGDTNIQSIALYLADLPGEGCPPHSDLVHCWLWRELQSRNWAPMASHSLMHS